MHQRAKNRPGTKPKVPQEALEEVRAKLVAENPYGDGEENGAMLGASMLKRNKGVMDSIQGIEWK